MMNKELINFTRELIEINSVSSESNLKLISLLKGKFLNNNFEIEILEYDDANGVKKYNLIAQKGEGRGGLAFLIHSDTVPLAMPNQLNSFIENNRIYGRGACDMTGPAAASILAGLETNNIKGLLTYIITSDEEIGCIGAEYISKNSILLRKNPPEWGIATEPTELRPIYAHKGLCNITVTATGKAAHSSTTIGDSANFKMIPFLYFISQIKEKYDSNKTYQNSDFDPPTNTLNVTMSDFNCAPNITAAKSSCKICFRAMPHTGTMGIIKEIENEALKHGLDFSYQLLDSLHTDKESILVKKAEDITEKKSETVAYLTDASQFTGILKPIILGPGSIKQAHTVNEYIDIDELMNGFEIYKKLIYSLA